MSSRFPLDLAGHVCWMPGQEVRMEQDARGTLAQMSALLVLVRTVKLRLGKPPLT